VKEKQIVAEVKSVNSKQLDLGLRLPPSLRDKDIEIRNLIEAVAERGKVDVQIYFDGESSDRKMILNRALAANYYQELISFSRELKSTEQGLLQMVMNLPDVFKQQIAEVSEDEMKKIKQLIQQALTQFNTFRKAEGATLAKDLEKRIQAILNLLKKVEQADSKRLKNIKERIKKVGMRNSLLLAPMPTASTSQILVNNEACEPFTSVIYKRRTLAGEFVIINKHLIHDLLEIGLWNEELKNKIISNERSIQEIEEIDQNFN
jgi:ribonucleoside-diphosphate reductase alpha chain